ncbi:hypothetical protein H2200_011890 [Cladophialophora chaetospira]|uniref:Uncharacterized protein n=1 Tax=Cladophialophora chaetospira TaxID=386627 RepID=A0AA38WYX3_9EURO|nr:hypothetical protein H2200_011890 [Cladophialophora chaetospira]
MANGIAVSLTELVKSGEEQAKEDERIAKEAEAEAERAIEEERLAREAEEQLQAQRVEHENASTQYKQTQTKSCPGCSAPIEKNGGCDHITCTPVAAEPANDAPVDGDGGGEIEP